MTSATTMQTELEACTKYVQWLEERLLRYARGDDETSLKVDPDGRFWLGRLAPEEAAQDSRGERLAPCAIGIKLRIPTAPPLRFRASVAVCIWVYDRHSDIWRKRRVPLQEVAIELMEHGRHAFGQKQLSRALETTSGLKDYALEVITEFDVGLDGEPELTVTLVNRSPEKRRQVDFNLYETQLTLEGLETRPFLLEALPDSFRYDRRVMAYGHNCAVLARDGKFVTQDTAVVDRGRSVFWNGEGAEPDLRFATLAEEPVASSAALAEAFEGWGKNAWAPEELDRRAQAEQWSPEMRAEATRGASDFEMELERIRGGVDLLRTNRELCRAFRLMNAALLRSARGRYDRWRSFQLGFLLANLVALVDTTTEAETADIVWFATGGGKTETYLGIVVTAAFFDRLTGKKSGMTAWSRFPLRMLSMQQTQRFADALASAELVRRDQRIPGAPFSIGFFVGQSSTPNSIPKEPKEYEPNPDDETMPARYRVLIRCPFCQGEQLEMRFDRRAWRLEHHCLLETCDWKGRGALPFYIVDDEIYRFLPTVVLGTLDKAATISMQASMRGFVGAPWGLCATPDHGYTYASRSTKKNGCLVPDCRAEQKALPQAQELFPPRIRLQDELHLLKDSLGAVDSHYEALLDHLQVELAGRKSKVVGSSATLAGFEKQVSVLYRRRARVFPVLGPTATRGFWSSESGDLARRFVAVAPRGSTIENAVDRTVELLQNEARRLVADPAGACGAAGIHPAHASLLVRLYGVNVVYGNTHRDIEAAIRSFETEIRVQGSVLNHESLTGRSGFEGVRKTLERLERPEESFEDRVHLIAASAMMSHGVDIDRLNTLIVLGLPLTTAEFIQTTARVGRKYPALVLVFPKMARERDAGVFRHFDHFVRQGDRFVEAVPITGQSRRVLEQTAAGLALARILHLHEPAATASLVALPALRKFFEGSGITAQTELDALVAALGFEGAAHEPLREDLREWFEHFFRGLKNPGTGSQFASDLCKHGKPMKSLRDVEAQVPVIGVSDR